jgi:hypothetical protein
MPTDATVLESQRLILQSRAIVARLVDLRADLAATKSRHRKTINESLKALADTQAVLAIEEVTPLVTQISALPNNRCGSTPDALV